MTLFNGYQAAEIEYYALAPAARLAEADRRERIAQFRTRLSETEARGEVVFISLGGDCGPAIRLKEAGRLPLGAFYFALVCPVEGVVRLLTEGFDTALRLENLSIGAWEDMDSVYDAGMGGYFHHVFSLPTEKTYPDGRRRIDREDIPMLLPLVRAKFAYLAEKFAVVCRSPIRKAFIVRDAGQGPTGVEAIASLQEALTRFGSINFELAPVYAFGRPPRRARQFHIPVKERWGGVEDWRALTDRLEAGVSASPMRPIVEALRKLG